MPPFIARNAFKVALAAAAVLLALVIGLETNWGAGRAPLSPASGPRPSLAEAKLLPAVPQVPAEQAYPETGARPLFTPARRPAPAGAVAGTMAKGQYTLHGVTIVDGLAIAMLKDKSSGKTFRAEKGKEFNGMTIGAIERDRVTLVQGEESEVVTLLVVRSAATTTAFVPAGPFGAVPGAPAGSGVAPVAQPPVNTAVMAQPEPQGAPQSMVTGGTRSPLGAAPAAAAAAPATESTMNERLDAARARRAQRFQQQQEAAKPQNVQK